jgi:hypothetical protein
MWYGSIVISATGTNENTKSSKLQKRNHAISQKDRPRPTRYSKQKQFIHSLKKAEQKWKTWIKRKLQNVKINPALLKKFEQIRFQKEKREQTKHIKAVKAEKQKGLLI